MGMQVNLASRLETACPAGGILISHSTWALVKDEIDCVPRGNIRVKGFMRSVKVYEIVLDGENDPIPFSESLEEGMLMKAVDLN